MDHLKLVCWWENMMKRPTKTLAKVGSKFKRDLSWSLQPIFLWMQLLGIPSGQLHLSSAFRRYTVLLVGMAMMIWVVPSNIRPILAFIHTGKSLSRTKVTVIWFETLQEFQYVFLNILISLSLFITAHLQWRSMWKNAIKVEYGMIFDKAFYCSVRKTSIAALVLLTLETGYVVYRYFNIDLSNLSITAAVLEMGFLLTQLYPLSAVILFTCLTWTASMMLQRLIDQLPTDGIPLHIELNQQLVKWKRNLALINDYIQKINNYFGVILLAFLAKQLVNFVTYIYFLIKAMQTNDLVSLKFLSVSLVKTVIYVTLLALVSHRIKQKVQKAGQQLRNLKFSDNIVQCQVSFLIIDLSINPPKISAMGVFEIGPNLFPSFIGITMTYLMVLWQFEFSSQNTNNSQLDDTSNLLHL